MQHRARSSTRRVRDDICEIGIPRREVDLKRLNGEADHGTEHDHFQCCVRIRPA